MARIIHNGAVYREISLKMFHESEVQAALASRAEIVFPGYVYVPFDSLVVADADSARPDFVLIETGYRRWYVGEVEMVRHDLIRHVIRQIRVFLSGNYGEEHAEKILDQRPDLDRKRLHLLVETVPPIVLVVTDKLDETWIHVIHSEGAKVAIFEMFQREDTSELMFSIDGDAPEIPTDLISYCEHDPSMPRLLKIRQPAGIPAIHGQRLRIEFNGVLTEWVFMLGDDKAWLNPIGYPEVAGDARFRLSISHDGNLKLEAK